MRDFLLAVETMYLVIMSVDALRITITESGTTTTWRRPNMRTLRGFLWEGWSPNDFESAAVLEESEVYFGGRLAFDLGAQTHRLRGILRDARPEWDSADERVDYFRRAGELEIVSIVISSPGRIELGGLAGVIRELRLFLKDLRFRNRQEQEQNELELEAARQLLLRLGADPHYMVVTRAHLLLSLGAARLQRLEKRGLLMHLDETLLGVADEDSGRES